MHLRFSPYVLVYSWSPSMLGKSWNSAGLGLRSLSLRRGWAWTWPLCPAPRRRRSDREACQRRGQRQRGVFFCASEAGRRGAGDCSPPVALKGREADPEDTELALGLKHLPGGELERHLHHGLDVSIELGEEAGLREPPELERGTDVNNKHTGLRESTDRWVAWEFGLTGQFLPPLPRRRCRVSRLDTPTARPCSRWSPPPCTWSLRAEWEENAVLFKKTETSHYIQLGTDKALETGVFQLLQQRWGGGGWFNNYSLQNGEASFVVKKVFVCFSSSRTSFHLTTS